MKTALELEVWLKSGKYLPAPLRDFHDQKDLFKAIDDLTTPYAEGFIKRPNFVEAQCYVIDVFLWFMARRGYTLQKTRIKGAFRNLEDDVHSEKERRNAAFIEAMKAKQ